MDIWGVNKLEKINMNRLTIVLLLLVLGTGFQSLSQSTEMDYVYVEKLENWQRSMTRWKTKYFVPLTGLYKLKEGPNTFGSGEKVDIVIQSGSAPGFMGTIIKKGKSISYEAPSDLLVTKKADTVQNITYSFDSDRNSEVLTSGFMHWFIQFVNEDYYLRVRDEVSPLIREFQPFDYYDANGEFIVEGIFKPYKNHKVFKVNNVLHSTIEKTFIGSLTFRYQGEKYTLEVLDGYFLMFSDDTNGDTTFPIGRYVRLDEPDENGVIKIDFNYSFSPPRSVSKYTTCEYPPAQNYLPFRVEAGEMYDNEYGDYKVPSHLQRKK